MTCEQYDDTLNDYVDGSTSDGRSEAMQAFTRHLDGCDRCQALVRDFGLIRRAARSLPTSVPPATVWSRLETELAPTAPRHSRAWLPLAAAAAVALLVARGSAPVALSRATSPVALADDGDAAWLDERSYTGAIDRLQAIDNAPPDVETDPSATAAIRAGLDTLDSAIADAREALDREPESVVAQEGLLDALDTKVALLQDTMAFLEDPTP